MSGFLENKLAMRPPCLGFRSPLTRFFSSDKCLELLLVSTGMQQFCGLGFLRC